MASADPTPGAAYEPVAIGILEPIDVAFCPSVARIAGLQNLRVVVCEQRIRVAEPTVTAKSLELRWARL